MATAEHHVEHHSVTGVDNRKLLMWIFLGSECLFFGALISTYLIFKADIPPRTRASSTPIPTSRTATRS